MKVVFDYESTDYQLFNEKKIANWIEKVIKNENFILGEVFYHFISPVELLEINRQFLDHNYDTDIITFDNCYLKVVSGELFISIEQIKYSANNLDLDFYTELYRVIIHGILHLIGYTDSSEDSKCVMREAENKYLCQLDIN